MPKRKYYGYYRGRYRGRGRYAFAAHMIAYPIAFIILSILAFVVSQPWLTLSIVALVVVVLIAKSRGGRKAAIPTLPKKSEYASAVPLLDANAASMTGRTGTSPTLYAKPAIPKVLSCGHEYKVENVYLGFDGKRNCRICLKERSKNYPILADNSSANARYLKRNASVPAKAPYVYQAPPPPREGELVITEYVNHQWRKRTIDTMNEG